MYYAKHSTITFKHSNSLHLPFAASHFYCLVFHKNEASLARNTSHRHHVALLYAMVSRDRELSVVGIYCTNTAKKMFFNNFTHTDWKYCSVQGGCALLCVCVCVCVWVGETAPIMHCERGTIVSGSCINKAAFPKAATDWLPQHPLKATVWKDCGGEFPGPCWCAFQ